MNALRQIARLAGVWMLLCLVSGSTFANAVETAPSADPAQVIRDATDQLLVQLQTKQETLSTDQAALQQVIADAIAPVLDLKRATRLILGRNYRKATDEQREQFAREFQSMLLRTYAASLLKYADDIVFEYLPEVPASRPDRRSVRTRLSYKNSPPIPVNYKLHKTDQGWLIYDVTILGVSAVVMFRNTFGEEIKRHGMAGFLERLSARTERYY
ncbi:MAG: MlaC/ttg2D family ABC transporter substrate-binding protein [Gammaproteobacteria bacterium]